MMNKENELALQEFDKIVNDLKGKYDVAMLNHYLSAIPNKINHEKLLVYKGIEKVAIDQFNITRNELVRLLTPPIIDCKRIIIYLSYVDFSIDKGIIMSMLNINERAYFRYRKDTEERLKDETGAYNHFIDKYNLIKKQAKRWQK